MTRRSLISYESFLHFRIFWPTRAAGSHPPRCLAQRIQHLWKKEKRWLFFPIYIVLIRIAGLFWPCPTVLLHVFLEQLHHEIMVNLPKLRTKVSHHSYCVYWPWTGSKYYVQFRIIYSFSSSIFVDTFDKAKSTN